jgi:tetratricopeptide (TPR) repeat protein
MDDTSTQAKEIFLAALEKGAPTARAAYLDGACRADAALRERVEALLQAHDESQNPLDKPAVELGPTELHMPELEQPGMLIGPYKLMEKIGEGGFGLVFVAEQQQPVRRRVALKVIKPGMDTREVIARFEAERQALALMDHPHIARVLDAGATATGRPYFVMELVRGVPITEYCDQHQLTPRERLELFVTVCQAVQHAHQIVAKDGVAWVKEGINGLLHFPQEPGKLDPRTVELWLQVILRGELAEADTFASWDEATWESHRRELAQRQVQLGKFSFPGVMADDRLYWLRREVETAVKSATRGPDAQRRALELTDRLTREEPTWQSHALRATLFAKLHRYADSVRDQLEVARIAGRHRVTGESRQARFDLAQQKDRPAAEYELLLQTQRDNAWHGDAVFRSLALYRLGRHQEAIEFIESTEKSSTIEAAAQSAVRALCLLALGEKKAAQEAFRTALPDFDPAHPNFLFRQTDVLTEEEEWRLDLTDDLLPVLPVLTGEEAEKQR